jgi:hypothetical protein
MTGQEYVDPYIAPNEARYVVSVNIIVTATDPDEAAMTVERMLAGVADHDVIDTFAEDVDAR